MTAITKTILLASSAAILAVTGMISAVDAAKAGRNSGAKQHQSGAVKHSSAGKHSAGKRHGNYNRRRGNNNNVARRALRGVFIAGTSSGCSYSYRKWQATGSGYWRSRYYDCRNG